MNTKLLGVVEYNGRSKIISTWVEMSPSESGFPEERMLWVKGFMKEMSLKLAPER